MNTAASIVTPFGGLQRTKSVTEHTRRCHRSLLRVTSRLRPVDRWHLRDCRRPCGRLSGILAPCASCRHSRFPHGRWRTLRCIFRSSFTSRQTSSMRTFLTTPRGCRLRGRRALRLCRPPPAHRLRDAAVPALFASVAQFAPQVRALRFGPLRAARQRGAPAVHGAARPRPPESRSRHLTALPLPNFAPAQLLPGVPAPAKLCPGVPAPAKLHPRVLAPAKLCPRVPAPAKRLPGVPAPANIDHELCAGRRRQPLDGLQQQGRIHSARISASEQFAHLHLMCASGVQLCKSLVH
jgi:hypothetical protein